MLKCGSSWLALPPIVAGIDASAAVTGGYPGPGEYRIDSDAVTVIGDPAQGMEQTLTTDGASGTVTSTVKTPGQPAASQVVRTGKPVTWCVKPAATGDVPRNSPMACNTLDAHATSTSSSFTAACRSMAVANTFRRIDPQTWDHTMTFQVRQDADAMRSVRESMALAMARMSPAERAQAEKDLAELPTQAQIDSSNADARRDLEEAIANGPPEQAAENRQMLKQLQQAQSGGAVRQTTRVNERWTLLSVSCSTGR